MIERIFYLLKRLTDAVVLFDEFELMVLDRDFNEGVARFAGWETGLVTDVMLPHLQELHDDGRIIYVLATNNIEKIDSAIWREGRFDYRLPVGPPDCLEKEKLLGKELAGLGWDISRLVGISQGLATIGELIAWCNLLKKSPSPADYANSKRIWEERFSPSLRLTKKDIKKLNSQKKKYASRQMLV
jgi:SpoVK/Ycf46/Vps4 family AAA+-type ATPase